VRGRLDPGALAKAVNDVVRRHETLRTTFGTSNGRPVQRIAAEVRIDLPVLDLGALPSAARETEARRIAAAEARQPFDLIHGPLLRVALVRLAADDQLVLVTLHHIVSDGWSLDLFVRELAAFYGGAVPPPLPVQYADYAAWQRRRLAGPALRAEIEHWRQILEGAPAVLELQADHPRPPVLTYRGGVQGFDLPAPLAAGLTAFGRRHDATLFMVLLAAFQILLARLTGREDLVVGTPVANRDREETEGLIGFFMNTLVLRTSLTGEPGLAGLLPRVRETALAAYAHQELPFEKLVEELKPARDLAHAPLFQVMFSLRRATPPPAFLGLELGTIPGDDPDTGTAKFDLTLSLVEGVEGLGGGIEHNRDLFDPSTVHRLAGHYAILLAAAVADPGRPLWELPLLTAGESAQLLKEWNNTAEPLPSEPAVHRWIEAQARRRPEAVAVEQRERQLTYAELDARADHLAERLRALGVGPERRVALCVERSPEMVVAVLAVMKAGGAWVPLDPGHPQERLRWILEDTGWPLLVATPGERQAELAREVGAVVWVDVEPPEGASARSPGREPRERGPLHVPEPSERATADALPPPPGASSTDDLLAYILFTSGSTGRPKGVQVARRGLANFLASMAVRPGLGEDDVLLAVTTLSFDISGLELLLPLITGARVVVASRDVAADGPRLAAALASHGATAMQATPATWRLLLESGWAPPAGFKVLCGGEALPGDLAARLGAGGAVVWNLYGPTETTIWSAIERVGADAVERSVVPLGRPIANTQIHLLGSRGEAVPAGVPGELLIGGAGAARGYVGRPDLTAERFVPDPWGAPGSRLYRTGDLARRLADGRLEFLGRLDHQVKIRGFRIELGEIEAALADHPAVRHAVVVDREAGLGDRRLVAYAEVEAGRTLTPLTVTEVRLFLRARLPEYMLPAAFVPLDRLPLNPSGKVDRRALPEPGSGRPALDAAFVAPREGLETTLAAFWGEILGVDRVGIHDNFFELGGHSLLLVRLHGRIAGELGTDLSLLELFEHPTVAALARRLEEMRGAGSPETAEDPGAERAGELRRGKEHRARRLARRTSDVEI
jgi:amino acid adenylation domain-containing protein